MHNSSQVLMRELLDQVNLFAAQVLDVGALDVNGTYRGLIVSRGWQYFGVDAQEGPNVDQVADAHNLHADLVGEVFDLVISGQMLEHDAQPFDTVREMDAVLIGGGYAVLIAPMVQAEHRYPIDCWRILPDGMRALAASVGWEVIECGSRDGTGGIRDTYMLARK